MDTDKRRGRTRTLICVFLCALVVPLLFVAGCSKPDKANIALRKQIQDLESQISNLQRQRDGDQATIRALESRATTIPTLPHDRLEQVFTTHGLKIGRLTGGADADPSKQGDEVLRVYAVPTDQRGDLLKAAGSFAIDAYDLSMPPDENHLGHWDVTTAEAADNWFGNAVMYGYTFTFPWQRAPRGDRVTVRVTFTDALTGRQFTSQKDVDVKPPLSVATEPATTMPSASR
jgi:outer membrane murein-binding lipoprotein Lpp